MNESDTILNELKAIAPFLAQLEKRNNFLVPAFYFEKSNADNISTSAVDFENENVELFVSKTNQFAVPADYFESLIDIVLNKINAEKNHSTEFNFGTKANSFNIPENYFENNMAAVLSKIKTAKVDEMEMMEVGNKTNSFAVPAGYFENNLTDVLAKIKTQEQPKGKFISWSNAVNIRRIAVAAGVMAIMLGSVWMLNRPTKVVENTPLTAQEITTYLDNNLDEVDEQTLIEHHEKQKPSTTTSAEKKTIKEFIENEADESTLNDLM